MARNEKKAIIFFLVPTIVVITIFLYLPIIVNLVDSLYDWGALSQKRSFVGIGNYTRMFKDDVFYIALKNNLVFIIMSVLCQIVLAFLIAAALESKLIRPFQIFFRTVYFVPSLLMVTVTGLTARMIYSPSIGLINPLLKMIGITNANVDLLGNKTSAIYAVSATSQWQYIGYTVILFLVAIQSIPNDLYEAADIDGAGAFKKLINITLPQLREIIMINMIIIVTGAVRVYDEVFVMTSGGPGRSTETLSTFLYRVGFKNDEMGYASAIAFFVFLITFILGIWQMKNYNINDTN